MSHPTFLQSLDCTSCWDPAVKQMRDTSSGHGEGGNKVVTGIFMKFKTNSHILYTSTKCQSMALSYVELYFKRHLDRLQSVLCPESILSLFSHKGKIISCTLYASEILHRKILNLFTCTCIATFLIKLLRVNMNQNFTDEVPVFNVIIWSMTNTPWQVWIFQKIKHKISRILTASSPFIVSFNDNSQFYHVFHMSTFLRKSHFLPPGNESQMKHPLREVITLSQTNLITNLPFSVHRSSWYFSFKLA